MVGDTAPDPFKAYKETDQVDLYLLVADVAQREKIDFRSLQREASNRVLPRVRTILAASLADDDDG